MTQPDKVAQIAAVVDRRPSMGVALLAALGSFVFFAVAGHFFTDAIGGTEATEERMLDIALVATIWTIWHIRYEPLAKLRNHLEGGR